MCCGVFVMLSCRPRAVPVPSPCRRVSSPAPRVVPSSVQKGQRQGKVALVASNPEKSKHLETATVRVDGFWVDFVNLRTESYLHDSRIPSINIGTPVEDAFRRCACACLRAPVCVRCCLYLDAV